MAEQSLNLELMFKDGENKNNKITITNPLPNLTTAVVQAAQTAIISANLFEKAGVNPYVAADGARYVERTVTDVYVVE